MPDFRQYVFVLAIEEKLYTLSLAFCVWHGVWLFPGLVQETETEQNRSKKARDLSVTTNKASLFLCSFLVSSSLSARDLMLYCTVILPPSTVVKPQSNNSAILNEL